MLTRACLILVLTATPAGAFEIGLPISCEIGTDCFIQNYVDRDDGPGAQDYACGAETYDGHKGTDIRLRSTADVEKGVPVLAVAPGIVVGTRDSMPDRLVRNDADRAAVGEQECGNGVRIDHGGGWFTQYCHMRRGSVTVKTGDKVETGAKLGEIGYSGMATFAHAHLTVEKDGKTVDPFLADAGVACGESGPSLWSAAAKEKLPYRAGVLLGFGVTDHPVALEELEDGAQLATPKPDTPVVAYLWAINLRKGDTIEVALKKDGEVVAENAATLDRDKAQYMLFAGKKAPTGGWPTGTYTGEAQVTRAGKDVIAETSEPVTFN
jgi:hypothetical protein